MLAMVLPRRHWLWRYRVDVSRGMTSLPSPADDGAAKVTLDMALPSRR
jgi:hypothetical protein